MPPAEPPAKETADGSAFMRVHEVLEVADVGLGAHDDGLRLGGERGERRRVAETSSGAWLVSIAPSITSPMTIIWLLSPARLEASCARPDRAAGARRRCRPRRSWG